jgi:hypothetical protein
MRFTWIEGGCILAIGIAALTQSGDRGVRPSSPHVVAPRAAVVADLNSKRQGDNSERTRALAGR